MLIVRLSSSSSSSSFIQQIKLVNGTSCALVAVILLALQGDASHRKLCPVILCENRQKKLNIAVTPESLWAAHKRCFSATCRSQFNPSRQDLALTEVQSL